MIVDGRELPADSEHSFELCIVGAGAAGIAMACELAGTSVRVGVLESGGFQLDAETQSLAEGSNTGFPYYDLDTSRLRMFGGTTNVWGGICRPFDSRDFRERSWVARSGWPVDRPELEPYYRRAHEICGLGPWTYAPSRWSSPSAEPFEFTTDRLESIVFQRQPTRFGETYRDILDKAENIRVMLHSNLVELIGDPPDRGLEGVRAVTMGGKQFTVRAQAYVLACGALENARILLASGRRRRTAIGNENDLVGRFFMEHLNALGGVFVPTDRVAASFYSEREVNGTRVFGALRPDIDSQRRDRALNSCAYLVPASLEEGVKGVAPGLVSSVVAAQSNNLLDDLGDHVRNVASDIDDLAAYSYRRFFDPPSERGAFYLSFHLEHAPNPSSRVKLTGETDALGIPRIELHWKFGEIERRTLRSSLRTIGRELGASGLGRVKAVSDRPDTGWPPGLRGAWHQMGTTRMADSPGRGVVNANCRVHSVPNLFVAGSSVFPTCGYANSTLTLVALSLRLADHLSEFVRK